ncbi:MAG TPA: hypothetical protein VFT83_02085, partial [Nitrososphaeraceae archaeon]|nr:hypothetical protein [Nitrososphaeraceae archaeon]
VLSVSLIPYTSDKLKTGQFRKMRINGTNKKGIDNLGIICCIFKSRIIIVYKDLTHLLQLL